MYNVVSFSLVENAIYNILSIIVSTSTFNYFPFHELSSTMLNKPTHCVPRIPLFHGLTYESPFSSTLVVSFGSVLDWIRNVILSVRLNIPGQRTARTPILCWLFEDTFNVGFQSLLLRLSEHLPDNDKIVFCKTKSNQYNSTMCICHIAT